MKNEPTHLFVYGTLLDERNEFAAYLKKNCSFYAAGKFSGLLYDIGEYPGAIFDAACGRYVYGLIYRLDETDGTTLRALDDYEGFGNDKPKPNEFIRELIDVETSGANVKCWVYLYNLPASGFWPIESGNYLEYLKIY